MITPRKIRRGFLRKLREACGLSQEAAAQRIGISVRALRAHESDDPPETMRAANLHAFAKLYKVKVDELLEPMVPIAMEAWRDYELDALHLTRLEVEAIREKLRAGGTGALRSENKREQAEWEQKAAKLGL